MYYLIAFLVFCILMMLWCWVEEEVEARRELELARLTDLDAIYREIWTGHDLDRVHAWYRVIAHLEAWHYDEDMIAEARRRMETLKEERISDSYVNVNGDPVLRRESI